MPRRSRSGFNEPGIKAKCTKFTSTKFVENHEKSRGKFGAVGLCFGGYIVNLLVASIPEDLDSGGPYYGSPAAEELRKNVWGPLVV